VESLTECRQIKNMREFIDIFVRLILALPRPAKRAFVVLVDIAMCVLSVWLAFYLRLGEFLNFFDGRISPLVVSVVMAVPIFTISGLYRAIFRFSGWPALLIVTRTILAYGVLYSLVFTVITVEGIPRTIGLIQPILLLIFIGITRVLASIWLGGRHLYILEKTSLVKVLVYGAGSTGIQLVNAIGNNQEIKVVGFLDDDRRLHGQVLNGKPIFCPDELDKLIKKHRLSEVLLAMPSLTRVRRSEILSKLRNSRISVRTVPRVADLIRGDVGVDELRELDLNELAGREAVVPDHKLLYQSVNRKVVMVLGSGGSIGSELCRQIISCGPKSLLLVDHDEYALYKIHSELESLSLDFKFKVMPLLASVQDSSRMLDIMKAFRPHVVYHAAAYKHVPLVEHNMSEGVKNNIFGTLRAAQAAIKNGVGNFVLISTDKAVRPTNVMGATKRVAEMILQALAVKETRTKLSIVRFGNVLDSSGSVVPKFRNQIKNGGPVTVTHPEVRRYFMTIPEAAQLVIQAGAMAKGGEVFVLDMGEPVRIYDLARRMIELSGKTIRDSDHSDGDIEIRFSGLRPGEKLYEELLIGNNILSTDHPRISKASEEFIGLDILSAKLEQMENALNSNEVVTIYAILQSMIEGYLPPSNPVDWITQENTL